MDHSKSQLVYSVVFSKYQQQVPVSQVVRLFVEMYVRERQKKLLSLEGLVEVALAARELRVCDPSFGMRRTKQGPEKSLSLTQVNMINSDAGRCICGVPL